MSSFEVALIEFYNGELLGETVYSALYAAAKEKAEKRKWATLMQLETETKAWLRPIMIAHGVGVEEHLADRQGAISLAGMLMPLSWRQQMQATLDAFTSRYLPAYQAFAEAARARGEADAEAVCLHMVAHENAQAEFARRELANDEHNSLAPVSTLLKYPIDG
jgi:hypothetical protein